VKKQELKSNDRVPRKDLCQTPAYAIVPLLPYLSGHIWECAEGEGYLVDSLKSHGYRVTGTDILTGCDFLDYPYSPDCDVILTNPPFSKKYKFLEKCYDLGKPFALLMQIEVLGAVTAQRLFKKYGFELMLLDKRVDFKMPNKGWNGKGAWFPVAWFCWKLLPEQIMFGTINKTT
jgi:hypothetical protein